MAKCTKCGVDIKSGGYDTEEHTYLDKHFLSGFCYFSIKLV
jgi:hypothetical protein